jgi:hypothetical protein
LARLLSRICSTCRPGLRLSILMYLCKHGQQVLDLLLSTSPGWQNVHELNLSVSICGS